MELIHHIDLVVSDLDRSLAFYGGLLEPLGYTRRSEITGERGEPVVYLGRTDGLESIGLRAVDSDAHPYSAGYYAVFLHDPDGIKLEIVHRPRD